LLFALAQRRSGRKVAVIMTDPPGVVRQTDSGLARILKRLDERIVKIMLSQADLVMTLAPQLASRFASDVPTLVFPGILDGTWAEQVSHNASTLPRRSELFTVVYAGSLQAAYGVDRLVEAVHGMACDSIRLKLFGRGNQEQRIKAVAAIDHRITYGGFVGNEALVPELIAADLLVNPRPTTEDFAVMSFPSKLIEYLAIGRPTLTTRIKSIPSDFQPHFLYIDDESGEGVRGALWRVMALERSELEAMAERGKAFVHANSSERAVGLQIREAVRKVECRSAT
jgi:glycosyltransferase involved in cell wall biosynthesis